MLYNDAILLLRGIWDELAYSRSLEMCLMWDQWTALPSGGAGFRAQMQGALAAKSAQILKTDNAKAVNEYFKDVKLDDIDNDIDRSIIRHYLTRYSKMTAVTPDMARQSAILTQQAQAAWIKAKQTNDYEVFKPFLKQQFEFRKESAGRIDPSRPAFEVLMSETDEDITLSDVNREFEKLSAAVAELIRKIEASGVTADDSFLTCEYDKRDVADFSQYLAIQMGYDLTKGRFGEAPHPFTCMIGPKDARVTGNPTSYKLGIFGMLHEAGHAMYGYGGNEGIDTANLWGGISGSFHEAQSRFYENIIAKSESFWATFYHEAQKRFPQLAGVTLTDYYRAINNVTPSVNRITADEVTYSIHPIIRYELEQAIFDGSLEFDDLPTAWNDKYEKLLGVRPQNDSEGLMSDIHWSVGMFAYFQSYTLGNLIGGQIRDAMLKAVPHVYDDISKGDFSSLNNWRIENIHQYGMCFTATEMLKRVTGEGLNADYFIAYLNEKYSHLYNLK